MRTGATVVITYWAASGPIDITDHCLFADCTFEYLMSAQPGTFTVSLKDTERELNFTTGRELTLDVDGIRMFGGFVLQVTKTYFFPADNTSDLDRVKSRKWVLEGSDYNYLFDRLVLHNTDGTASNGKPNYSQQIPTITSTTITDATIIRSYFDQYFDIPPGFDFDSDLIVPHHVTKKRFVWPTQGDSMRTVLDMWAKYASMYYIDPYRQLNFFPSDVIEAPWGFSDKPNNDPLGVGIPTRGFHDGSFTEDGGATINDAMVWGGSEWVNNTGAIVFARRTDAASIAAHGRWQVAENRVGEDNYKSQAEVNIRAKIIVNGNEEGINDEGNQGQVLPDKRFSCTWLNVGVPVDEDGNAVHLRVGQVVPIQLWVFSADGGLTPYEVTLPLRSITLTFPGLDARGAGYVQFQGSFGISNSDPKWLWHYLRGAMTRSPHVPIATSADNTSTAPAAGAQYQGEPSPMTDGVTTTFTIPFPYIPETSQLFVNGLMQDPGAFTESDPETGEFELFFVPDTDDTLMVEATLA